MLNQVYAQKMSMSQAFVEGKRIPLTILKVDPHLIERQKTVDNDGYSSMVLSVGTKTKKGKSLPKFIKEVKTEEVLELNSQLDLVSMLTPGSTVDVTAISKGKGFAGVMKRWNFSGGPRTHGQSDRGRAPGSIGRGTTPGRVLPGKKMAGRMGNASTQIRNLKIHSFDLSTGILQITGAIPGGRGALAKVAVTKHISNQ